MVAGSGLLSLTFQVFLSYFFISLKTSYFPTTQLFPTYFSIISHLFPKRFHTVSHFLTILLISQLHFPTISQLFLNNFSVKV